MSEDFPKDVKALGQAIQEAFDGSQQKRQDMMELIIKMSVNPELMTSELGWVGDTLVWKFVYRLDNKPYIIRLESDQVITQQLNEESHEG